MKFHFDSFLTELAVIILTILISKGQTNTSTMSEFHHNPMHKAVLANEAAVKEDIHHYNAELAKDRASDPRRGVLERVEAGTHYVGEKIKEGGEHISYEHNAEQAKHA